MKPMLLAGAFMALIFSFLPLQLLVPFVLVGMISVGIAESIA